MEQRLVSQVRDQLEQDRTDSTDRPEKMVPSRSRGYAAWELLPSDSELVKAVLWMIESV